MITFLELFYLIFASAVISVIFSRSFKFEEITNKFLIALLVFGLHESFHKIFASILGYPAFIRFSILGLSLGLFLRFLNSPIIIFVPGYVYIPTWINPFDDLIISIAGPLANLIILLFIKLVKTFLNKIYYRYYEFLHDLYKINYRILILNLIPIPPLDGGRVVVDLLSLLLG